MGKPLLTDEILEKVKRNSILTNLASLDTIVQTRIYQWMMLYSIHI